MKQFYSWIIFLIFVFGHAEVIANSITEVSYTEIKLAGSDLEKNGFSFDLYQKIVDKNVLSNLSVSLRETISGNRLEWVEVYLYENDQIICRYVEQSFSYKKDGRRGAILQINLSKVSKIEIHAVYDQTKYILSVNPSLI